MLRMPHNTNDPDFDDRFEDLTDEEIEQLENEYEPWELRR